MKSSNTGKILFVGDVSLDLTMVADHVPAPDEKVHADQTVEAPGGVVANAAVACARSGAKVGALLPMGSDTAASVIAMGLRDEGIELQVETVPGRTCRAVVIVEPHGEKRLLLDPGVSMYPSRQAIEALDLSRVAWVHTAIYGEAADVLVERCRAAGIPWSLDLEPASFSTGIETVAPLIDGAAILFCNDRAAVAIGPEAPARLLALGAKAVVRTMGPQGAGFFAAGVERRAAAPLLDKIVDTTGAGDCLAGWFIGETVGGASPQAALEAAVAAASLSCRALGAQNSYPTPIEVAEFRREAAKAIENIA
ncbi:MAG: carbohydrate kinase family protein [Rhizobiaceae bacterium]|nr:carbohydrate kinase family protein [Rhizobiaceae bacterium]